jgi:hypothetical protein
LRDGAWPAAAVAAGWIPGVLLASTRFDPRPEIVTLICLSAFFGVLLRARQRPGWLWALVPIQLLWVNCHGLFVLGPCTVALFLIDRAIAGGLPWRRILPPSLAVCLACLANPYGMRGTLVPLELFPKLTAAGGLYKSYIGEFMSTRDFVAAYWRPVPGRDLYLRLFVFLLCGLPLVFLVTSVERTWRASRPADDAAQDTPGAWTAAMAAAFGLALAVCLGLPNVATPAWQVAVGGAAPWILGGTGGLTALGLVRRSRRAAALAVLGAGATAAWIAWLVGHLYGTAAPLVAGALAIGLGLPAAWLAFHAGTRLFGPLLAASFGALGLLAVRNMSLFGLVAGAVLAAELGEWGTELFSAHPVRWRWRGLVARSVVLAAIGLLGTAVVRGSFFARTEECHRFGLRERPFYYAHDACRFAGQPGLPARALVFGLLQAGVYEFQNNPPRQVYIDGRLEVASRATFTAYVRLHQRLTAGDPRWETALGRLGERPLLIVDHEDNAPAEATLLADPRWRSVYFDAVAAVFVRRDADQSLQTGYPTIDFATRHFHGSARTAQPRNPRAALAEATALERVGAILAHRPVARWSLQVPMNLVAMDLARSAIDASPAAAGAWVVLGHAALGLAADPGLALVETSPRWDPAVDLPWAQARSAYRAAIARDRTDGAARRTLAASFALRAVNPLLEQQVAAEVRRRRPLPWRDADRLAETALLLGMPAEARRLWLEADACPSPAIRATRVADADLAAWDYADADAGYRRALALDPSLADAAIGLALSKLEQGQARPAVAAARTGLKAVDPLDATRRALLEQIEALCVEQGLQN